MGSAESSAPRASSRGHKAPEGDAWGWGLCNDSQSDAFVLIYRVRHYFSADVLLTNVLCDNNPDRGNKRQFLHMAPLWFSVCTGTYVQYILEQTLCLKSYPTAHRCLSMQPKNIQNTICSCCLTVVSFGATARSGGQRSASWLENN